MEGLDGPVKYLPIKHITSDDTKVESPDIEGFVAELEQICAKYGVTFDTRTEPMYLQAARKKPVFYLAYYDGHCFNDIANNSSLTDEQVEEAIKKNNQRKS